MNTLVPDSPPPLPANAYSRGKPVSADRFAVSVRRCASTGRDMTLCYQTFGASYIASEATNGTNAEWEGAKGRRRPVLLLIPGLGSSCYTWRDPFCELLASPSSSWPASPEREAAGDGGGEGRGGFHVIRMDNRDSGLSTHLDSCPTLTSTISKLAVAVLPQWWWTYVAAFLEALMAIVGLWEVPDDASMGERNKGAARRREGGGGSWRVLCCTKPPYTTEDMALDVEFLLRHLHLDDGQTPVHVMGVSMGGRIAQSLSLRFLAQQQQRSETEGCIYLRSVTLISTHTGAPVRGGGGGGCNGSGTARKSAAPEAWTSAPNSSLLLLVLSFPSLALRWAASLFVWVLSPVTWVGTGSGWSWRVVWAMIASTSSSSPTPSSREAEGQRSSLHEDMSRRATYASHFHGTVYKPDLVAYKRVKAIDLTRAPVDHAATMRQLWALRLSQPLDTALQRMFSSSPSPYHISGDKRSLRTAKSDALAPNTVERQRLRVLILHGMEDDTVNWANALHLAKLYSGSSSGSRAGGEEDGEVPGPLCDVKAVLFPQMGHTIPAQLYADIVAEVKSFCLSSTAP